MARHLTNFEGFFFSKRETWSPDSPRFCQKFSQGPGGIIKGQWWLTAHWNKAGYFLGVKVALGGWGPLDFHFAWSPNHSLVLLECLVTRNCWWVTETFVHKMGVQNPLLGNSGSFTTCFQWLDRSEIWTIKRGNSPIFPCFLFQVINHYQSLVFQTPCEHVGVWTPKHLLRKPLGGPYSSWEGIWRILKD